MAIPIRNIYYLLCYAWDRLEARTLVDVDALAGNRTEDLLGKVLQDGVSHLLRSGLDRGYLTIEQAERRLRGKLLVSETIGKSLLQTGRAACEVDDLSHDVAHNRVIKAAMSQLMTIPTLDQEIREGLRMHCRRLHDVSDIPLTIGAFRQVQLHRNLARYSFLVNVARLVALSFVPDPKTGARKFHPFTASDQQMGLLFEAFVRNFLRREQDQFDVAAPKVAWALDEGASSDPTWLPEMRTDITLSERNGTRSVIVEAKCYGSSFHQHHGSNKLISGHLYQILTYLSQKKARCDAAEIIGLLLYAGAEPVKPLHYRLGGHSVSVRSLDLNRVWQAIHADLMSIASWLGSKPQSMSLYA